MDTSLSPAVAAAVVILLTCFYYWMKNRGVVPGPIGVPYLGLYPYLTNEDIHLKLDEYTRKYGDVFSFTYTGKLYINLGSIRAMREILLNKSDCFMDRFQDTHLIIEMLRNGVAFVNGEPWKVLRKFFIQKFKEYGLSTIRDNMAGPVYDSLNTAIEELKNLDGKEINIVKFLGQRSEVTIRRIIFGEKGITDENVRKIIALYIEVLEGNVGANRLLTGPLARLLFTIKPSFRKNLKACKKLQKLVFECVQKVERSMNENNPTCIVEEFYIERNKRLRASDPTWKYFSDDALVGSMIQFVGDGIHSVSAFIAGILNILLEYPDEQEKLYSEMMEAIGPNRQLSIEDKPNLPYTNAFINEYIRQTCMINFLPSIECTRETTIRGHRIPVGSIILYNFRSAHLDPDTFEDPDIFNPARYMSSSGKSKAESPVIFGMGKRSCSGEAFVMLQIFLFLTTIVKNFKIVASNAPANSSTDFLIAEKLKLTFTPRTENQPLFVD